MLISHEQIIKVRETGPYCTAMQWHAQLQNGTYVSVEVGDPRPVMLILADHLDVPSSTLCLTCFIWVTCVALITPNTSWMSSKISGLFLSLIFMRSFSTIMMFCVRSSAPCLELFSAAPERQETKVVDVKRLGNFQDAAQTSLLTLISHLLVIFKHFLSSVDKRQDCTNYISEQIKTAQ